MSPFWINSFHNKCVMKTWMIGNSKLMKWKTIKIQHCQNSSAMFSVYTWLITRFVTRLIRWVPLVEQELSNMFSVYAWLITRFVTRLIRWVPLVEQKLFTLPEHLSSPPVFSGVRVTRSLVLYACFVDHCLSFCTFSFGHCVVCSSSIYGFWLPLWYLQTLLHVKCLPYILHMKTTVVTFIFLSINFNGLTYTEMPSDK